MTRTTVMTEPFTATNGTLSENLADASARWAGVDFTTTYTGVTSNKVNNLFSTGGYGMVFRETAGTYTNDQYAFATVGNMAAGNTQIGVVVRASGSASTSTYYSWEIDNRTAGASPFTTVLRKAVNQVVTGTDPRTTLDTRSVAWANGDVMLLEAVGTSLNCYKNGTLVFSVTDSSISTGRPGYAVTGNSTVGTLDDWEGGNVSGAAAGGFFRSSGNLSGLGSSGPFFQNPLQ